MSSDENPFAEDDISEEGSGDDFEEAFSGGAPQEGDAGGESVPNISEGGSGDLGNPDEWFPDITEDESAEEPETEEEEPEKVEDSIERVDIGISGLDDMITGGVPKGNTLSVMGDAGTGKTTFGMQFLEKGLKEGNKAVFISLEQTEESIIQTADEKGWNFSKYHEEDQLVVINMDPIEVATSLKSIRNELPRMISDFGATRIVLDSVTLIEMMFESDAERRNQIYRFTNKLSESGATTLVTSEGAEDSAYRSKYGIIEYLSDAVFVLRYVRTNDFEGTRLALEINKIRDTSHSRDTKPYELTNTGIKVYSQANLF